MSYVLKVDGKFFCHSGKVSAEYPDARQFESYTSAMKAVDLYQLTAKGGVELYGDYGLETETVEDV